MYLVNKHQSMKASSKQKVHFSGFLKPEKEELISKSKNMGFAIDSELTGKTDYLVCKSILIEKFRIAKILKIKVVNSKWIYESEKQGRVLTPDNYKFSTFENLKFFLLGFDNQQAKEVGKTLLENGGQMFIPKGKICFLKFKLF